jgi:simple sugar transport system permease protein
VATLILMVAGRGLATFLLEEKSITITQEGFAFLGRGHFLGFPFSITMVIIVFTLTALLLRKTALGMMIEAVGDNETASRYAGISSSKIKLLSYGFCGLCAGIVGLIDTSNIMVADPKEIGWMAELYAIFAVVVGGTALTGGRFSLRGAIIGALLLQTVWTTMFSTGVSSDTAPVPLAVLIVVVCLFQSDHFRTKARKLLTRKRKENPAS